MADTRISSTSEAARLVRRALDLVGWVLGGGVLLLLLSTGCWQAQELSESTVEVEAEAGPVEAEDLDDDGDGTADAHATNPDDGATADGSATAQAFDVRLGGGSVVEANVSGSSTRAAAFAEQTLCYTATVSDVLDLFQLMNVQVEIDCAGSDDNVEVTADWLIAVNDDPPIHVFDGDATIGCDDLVVTSSGFPEFVTSIPGFLFGSGGQIIAPDALPVEEGDEIRMTLRMTARASLPPEQSLAAIAVHGSHEGTLDYGLTPHFCNPFQCTLHEDCQLGEHCEFPLCRTHAFPKFNGATIATTPSPLAEGQPFSVTFGFDVVGAGVQPHSVHLTLAQPGLDYSGITTPNVVVASCSAAGISRPVLATTDPNVMYVDLDADATQDEGDAVIAVTETATDLVVDVSIPKGGDGDATVDTLPGGVTFSCAGFFGLFTPGPPGRYEGTGTVTSVDVTSGDANDGTGLAPLTTTFGLVLEDGVLEFAPPSNGDRDGDGVTDDEDECPDDPNKTTRGLCGCFIDDAAAGSACIVPMAIGRCARGILECSNGDTVCHALFEPTPEVCNGEDDDCDGTVDRHPNPQLQLEGEGEACQADALGRCATGSTVCENGTIRCAPSFPLDEVGCNGVDDDCDGVVDEGGCNEHAFDTFGCTVGLDPKPDKDKIALNATFSWADVVIDPVTDGLMLTIHPPNGTPLLVHFGPGAGWTTKLGRNGNAKWIFKDARDGSLGEPASTERATIACAVKTLRCTAKIAVQGLDLPAIAPGETTTAIVTGDDRIADTRTWELKGKGKKLVAAKDP